MVDLPTVPDRIVTTTAPTSSVSRRDIIQQSDMMAGAISKVADAQMEIATQQAKEQAANDLQEQKVVRNPDGSVEVVNPANSLIFGRAGEQYHAAVAAGTLAQHSNVISTELNDLHQKYPTDPAAFAAAAEKFKEGYVQQHGGGEGGQAIRQNFDSLQTQHYNSISNTTGQLDITNQQKSITATITDQKNTLQGLARQPGGTDTPEFKAAVERMEASYRALTTNPLFKMPPDQADLEVKNFKNLLQGEALVSHIDETFTKRGKGDAQKALNEGILQNPSLSEVDRTRLYSHGMARLQYLTADSKEKIDAGRKVVTELETNLASGVIKSTDPIIGMEIKQAIERGDAEAANRITAAVQARMSLTGIQTLPQTMQAEVLGIKPIGAVNTAIPAEGRALLDHIAGPESGGRYDVRYGGKQFQGYGDHPRVAEPITSGPDVGKTSSAAGRYQFIGSTWDQQKTKLGLTDFSPANQDAAAWDLAQTEYKTKTGRDLLGVLRSGDQAAISDVPRQLSGQWSSLPGGRQPAGVVAPAANNGPGFTAADLKRNPFLGSAYVRTIAADESLRIQSATQAAAGIGKAVDNGLLPRAEDVALVNQTAAQYPEKFGPTAEAMNGKLLGGALAQMEKPQRDAVLAQYREATNGQDQHHMNVAAAALEQYGKSEKALVEHPYQEAATRGWIAPVAPIDPSQPESIPAALTQRVAASERIAAMNHSPAPPVLDKDEMPQLQAALEGPAGAGVLGAIATNLKPDDLHTLLGQKGFTDSLTSMMSSKDPVKMSTAMSVVDRLWRDNAAEAESTLGAPAITKLQAWQGLKGSFSAIELAERLNASDDPSTVTARNAAKKAAEGETENLKPDDMAYKMGTSFGIPLLSRAANVVTGATPSAPFDSIKGGELVADYRQTYTALRTYGVDAKKASELSLQRLGATWGVSAAAGNQVMKNPPERSYPAIGGSHDWIKDDLSAWVTGKLGMPETGSPVREVASSSNIPPALRAFTTTVAGDTSTITEKFFSSDELSILRRTAETQIAKGKHVIGYGDYGEKDPWAEGSKAVFNAMTDPAMSLAFTLGMASVKKEADGTIVITDKYDFAANRKQVDQEGGTFWQRSKLLLQGARDNGLLGVGNVIGNLAAPAGEGRNVTIRIPPEKEGPEAPPPPRTYKSLEMGISGVIPERNWSVQGLIADKQTQAEIAAGRPPSYQVAVKRRDGTLDIIPSRIAFDPSDHAAKHGASLEERRQAAEYQRSGQFQNVMPLP